MFKIDEMDSVKEFKIIYKDGSEINYDKNGYSYRTTEEGENSSSHVLVSKDSIDMSVNEKIKSIAVEEANISTLDCLKITAGQINTDRVVSWVSDGESYLNKVSDECMCEECHKDEEDVDGEKSVYAEVMDYSIDKLEKELWDTLKNTGEEADVCPECVIRFYLEMGYSLGYQEGVRFFKNRMDEVNMQIRDELIEKVHELGFSDEDY